ncbi:hypothetical protein WK18_18125 [Burkholderia ubonensis]|uniref:hypothetical protein n=1 Tax=Burkholderia ubonensis TaxID=101571 RepID=UPI0007547F84|nr:hypothetical protein [Burkholderia ubonensis]KVR43358.1 hypothetical protein WK18_18125 [Burkholderia ubonensis]KWB80170.1 hypothetical protein WL41_00590 [Burkholderia ubonensis]
MARIRTIKPEFWTDEKVAMLSPAARLLFIGTWNYADDGGNLEYSSMRLKMQIFPGDDIDCEPLIASLIAHGMLIEYSVSGKKYLHIRTFNKHQVINRPSKSRLPEFRRAASVEDSKSNHGVRSEDSVSDNGALTDGSLTEVEVEGNLSNSRRQYTAAGEPVDNSAEGQEQQKSETTTEGNRTDSQNPNTESQELGAGGAADASDGSRHAEGGASGVAPGNREPDDDLPPLAVSTEWFRQRGVLIDDTNDLLIGWRRAGVTEGQFTVAIAKAKQYKLKHIPANYLAQIVDEMVNPPERAAKRIALGDDEQSLKAAAKALGMDEGRQGESLKQYRARILERMNETRSPA